MSSVLLFWQASHAVRTSAGENGDDSIYGGNGDDIQLYGASSCVSSVLSFWQASHAVRTSAGGEGDDSLFGGDGDDSLLNGASSCE